MKLRNKKTGEIVEYDSIGFRKGQSNGWDDFVPNADSLAALNEVWEDYKPAEPLIKNEKIRKAVRAWAEMHRVKRVLYHVYFYHSELAYIEGVEENGESLGVGMDIFTLPELKKSEFYTIAELCGEEQE